MPDRRDRPRRAMAALAVALGVLLVASPEAGAHKIHVFAEAEGTTLRGEAYFSGGGHPRDAKVDVLGPGGTRLGEVRTDAEGRFAFRATRRCDHTFVIETADGHRAEYTVEAGELPGSLPGVRAARVTQPAAKEGTPPASAPASADEPAGPAALRRVIAQAVRKELDRHEQRVRLRDVLGGVGYIFGIMGIVLLVRQRRKAKPAA
jgi:nickel transport protein